MLITDVPKEGGLYAPHTSPFLPKNGSPTGLIVTESKDGR